MKHILFSLLVVITLIGCDKSSVSKITLNVINPTEGAVISFGGFPNRLYFVRAKVISSKELKQLEISIINKANNSIILSTIDNGCEGADDYDLELSSYMPSGPSIINAAITVKAIDKDGFSETKIINYQLVP